MCKGIAFQNQYHGHSLTTNKTIVKITRNPNIRNGTIIVINNDRPDTIINISNANPSRSLFVSSENTYVPRKCTHSITTRENNTIIAVKAPIKINGMSIKL